VDFNDQRRGRLTVIRDLLDRLPDFDVPQTAVELAPLKREPRRETFGQVKPLKRFGD